MLRKRSVETLAQAGKRLQCVCYREASNVHCKTTSLSPKPGRSSEHLFAYRVSTQEKLVIITLKVLSL